MIVDEVRNFRQLVRMQAEIPDAGGAVAQNSRRDSLAVASDGLFEYTDMPPKPQEVGGLDETALLEQELANVIDGR